jgi:hypothetical protein
LDKTLSVTLREKGPSCSLHVAYLQHLTVTAMVHAFAGGDDPESKPFPPFLVETSRTPGP